MLNIFVVPSEPQQVKTCSVNSTSVTLLWNPPEYSNGVITHYSIYCDGVDINQFGDVSDDQMTGTVEGLSPDTVYVLKLKAHTIVGPGPPVSLAVKTRELMNFGILNLEFHISYVIIALRGTSIIFQMPNMYSRVLHEDRDLYI